MEVGTTPGIDIGTGPCPGTGPDTGKGPFKERIKMNLDYVLICSPKLCEL